MSVLLHIEDVSLAFGGVQALAGVSFEVHEGEIVGLLGPNGAGKSSLLNVLAGAYRPTGGAAWFDGRDVSGLRPAAAVRLGIGRTFQSLSLFDGLTVAENVLIGRHRHGRGTFLRDVLPAFGRARREERRDAEVVASLLRRLELEDFAGARVAELPYGVQKRVDLARALALEPRLLLLDEPLAGMAPGERHRLGGLILDAWRQLGLTVLLVEHDAAFVADVADRIAVLDFGRLIADGAPEDVLRDPAVVRAYLGDVAAVDGGR